MRMRKRHYEYQDDGDVSLDVPRKSEEKGEEECSDILSTRMMGM